MVYECKTCKFETPIKTHFGRHILTKKHIELCVFIEPVEKEEVNQLMYENEDLKKQILELQHQLQMKDIIIDSKDQMIELLKSVQITQPIQSHKKKPTETEEEKKEKHRIKDEEEAKIKAEENRVKTEEEIKKIESILELMDNSEQSAYLNKYNTTLPKVIDWICNKNCELLSTNDVYTPEFIKTEVIRQMPIQIGPKIEIEPETMYSKTRLLSYPSGTKWYEYGGIMYIINAENEVYDIDTEEQIGTVNDGEFKYC